MTNEYKGIIVEESLSDNRIMNDFKIINFKISEAEHPADRWHMYTVMMSTEDLNRLSESIKPGWYAHFWKNRDVIAIFHDKKFAFNYDDKSSWTPVVEYGLSIGIPNEQLDFPID